MLDPTNFSLDAMTDSVDRLILEELTTTEDPVSKIVEKLGLSTNRIYSSLRQQ